MSKADFEPNEVRCPNCNKKELIRKMGPVLRFAFYTSLILFIGGVAILIILPNLPIWLSETISFSSLAGMALIVITQIVYFAYIRTAIKAKCHECGSIVFLKFHKNRSKYGEWEIIDSSIGVEKPSSFLTTIGNSILVLIIAIGSLAIPCIIGATITFILFGANWIEYSDSENTNAIFASISRFVGNIVGLIRTPLGIDSVKGTTTSQFLWISGILSVFFAGVLAYGLEIFPFNKKKS